MISPPTSRFLHPATALALLLCAGLALLVWAAANRPVTPVDFRGRIAGLAFSPFQRGQSPEDGTLPSAAQLRADLALVAGMTDRIRTYSVDGILGDIPRLAEGTGLRVTLGAWLADANLPGNAAANARELDRLVRVANASRNVERVMVGNETLLRGDLTPAALIEAVRRVKRDVRVPVSTAEPWHVWLDAEHRYKARELAEAVDFITVHLLDYWEQVPVEDAVRDTLDKLDRVQRLYPGKKIVIGEAGWPSDGVAQGRARASRVNQALFLRAFLDAARQRGLDYFVIEAFDQPWKTSFEGRAAGYWGVLDLDRHAKFPWTGPVQETPSWPLWAGGSIGAAALLAWLLLSRRPDIRPAGKLLLAALAQGFVASMALVLLAMSGKYLSPAAACVWAALAIGQMLLLGLLLADSFELAETIWGRVWRRRLTVAPATSRRPKVSIHLPICNEPPHMVRRTLDALAALDYADFEVVVVDNNTTDPALWEPVARHCARLGPRFRFFTLGKWPGFKAGALNFALRQTAEDAEIIGVLDSDYVVAPDWLRCMVPHFGDASVGFVQSPQDYRDIGDKFFKRAMFWEYAGFFHLGMVTRNERNAIIQHGTMTLIRRTALETQNSNGSWAEWCICEDAELGLRLFRAGWQAVYSARSFGRGVMPDDFAAYRKQRFRWAFGAMQICRHHWRALLSPFNRDLTPGQRWHFVTGWLPWVGDALGLMFLALALAWSVGLVLAPQRFEFPIVPFMLPSIGLFVFKLAQTLLLYNKRVPCRPADRIAAVVAGLALSPTIGRAVGKGLLIGRAPFLRTPKLRDAPALVQGLVMAREEACILVLTLAALAGVAVAHRFGTWEARLWCVVLLTQAMPYAAAVTVAIAAAMPSVVRPRALAPAGEWSPSGAGD